MRGLLSKINKGSKSLTLLREGSFSQRGNISVKDNQTEYVPRGPRFSVTVEFLADTFKISGSQQLLFSEDQSQASNRGTCGHGQHLPRGGFLTPV